jgi:hypothetical protein
MSVKTGWRVIFILAIIALIVWVPLITTGRVVLW